MNIGDDWFTKTMLVNTLSRAGKVPSQIGVTNVSLENSFAKVLSQLLMQIETKASGQSELNLFDSALFNTVNPITSYQNTQPNIDGPLSFEQLNAEEMNRHLDGKLTGMGEAFISAGKKYHIDPALLTAIAQHESANGKSLAADVKNNIAGMMGKSGLKSYESVEDSIMDMARNLSKNYLAKGLTSIAEIGAKYAPVGASNDPTGLNNHWVRGVTKFYNKLKA